MIKRALLLFLLSGTSLFSQTVEIRPAVTFPFSFWQSSVTPTPTPTITPTPTPTITPTPTPSITPTPTPTVTPTPTPSATPTPTLTPTPTPTPTPPSSPLTLTYVSDGDANGVAYLLGTDFYSIAWANPHTAGRCVVQASSLQAGTVALFVDRAGPDFADSGTDNIPNSWIAIDLGSGRALVVDKYTLRNRAFDGTRPMRNWKLQGSNDAASNSVSDLAAATWADIDIRVADTTMGAVANEFTTYTANQSNSTPYRWIRVLQNGVNGNSDHYLLIAEEEFYGTLTF